MDRSISQRNGSVCRADALRGRIAGIGDRGERVDPDMLVELAMREDETLACRRTADRARGTRRVH